MKTPSCSRLLSWRSALTFGAFCGALFVGFMLPHIPRCFGSCTLSVGSSPQQIIASGTGVFVANQGDGSVSFIDTSRNRVEKTITVGSNPYYAAKSGTGLYVGNQGDATMSVIDTVKLTVDATISIGANAYGTYASGGIVYVGNRDDDTVSVISASTNTVTATVTVGDGPYAFVRNGTGVYVANVDTNTVSVIDTTTNTVDATITVGDTPTSLAAVGTGVYVSNANSNTVSIIDRRTNRVAKTVTVGSYPTTVGTTGTGVFVLNYFGSTMSVINTPTNTVIRTISVGSFPYSIGFAGTGAYVPNLSSDTVSVIDVIRLVNAKTISGGDGPHYVAISGTNVYVSNLNSETVTVISTATNTERSYCVDAVCGDGFVDLPEECDDGDASSGDGCSSSCTVESGWSCTGNGIDPSTCVENNICTALVYYPFDNTSGTFVSINGTFTASTDVPTVEPSGGESLIFDGSTNSMVISRPVQDDFTICAWFKTTASGNGTSHWQSMAIADAELGGLANDFGFGLDSAGKLMFGNGGNSDVTARTATAVNTGNWTHGCVTRVKSTGAFRLFINGVRDGMGTGSTVSLSADTQVIIGDGDDGAANWNGKLDEVRFYGYALSASEILSLYSGSCNPASSSSSSSSATPVQSSGGRHGQTGNDTIKKALEQRASQYSSAAASTASSAQSSSSSVSSPPVALLSSLEQRTCARMRKWFSWSPAAFERVNGRVMKRLGFECR